MTLPVISILIPTRGRPDNLRACILSCFDLARHPERVEIMAGVDSDDPFLEHNMNVFRSFMPVMKLGVCIVHEQRYGYARLHEYFNSLAKASTGSWLVNFNDDTEWLTPGFDDLLCEAPPVAVQLLRREGLATADPTFPATSRNIFEAMGHLSLNAHCDAWISDVSWWAGCQVIRNDIEFRHHCLADKTARERTDEMPVFKGAEQTALRTIDIEKVKKLMAGAQK